MAKKTVENTKADLPKRINGRSIPDMRQIIAKAMKRKHLTAYAVAKQLAPHVTEPTIQNFISGRSEMTAAKLAMVMAALDLEIQPRK